MRIHSAHIYGFGKWQNQHFDFDGQKLVLIAGPNEAGKTTLRAFILYLLFGLTPQKRSIYLPKHGGQLGGTLTISVNDGHIYTIERIHDRNSGEAICRDNQGQKMPKHWLTEQLNRIDFNLFERIFSFDALSLQHDRDISAEQLGEVLLSIGMIGSDRIYRAEKQLNQYLQDQFKPQGKKPHLNQLLEKLATKAKLLRQYEPAVSNYERNRQLKDQYQNELDEAQHVLNELTQQLRLLQEQKRIYPSIEAVHRLTDQLKKFPDPFVFPEQGQARFHELKEALRPLTSELELISQKESDVSKDLTDLLSQLMEANRREQLKQSLAGIDHYYKWLTQKKSLSDQIDQLAEKIADYFNQLKLGLSVEALLSLPLSYMTEEQWGFIHAENEHINEQLYPIKQQLGRVEQQEQTLQADLNEIEQTLIMETQLHELEHERELLQQKINDDDSLSQRYIQQNQLKQRQFLITIFILTFIGSATGVFLSWQALNLFFWLIPLVILLTSLGLLIYQKRQTVKLIKLVKQADLTTDQQKHDHLERKARIDQQIAQYQQQRETILLLKQELKQNQIEQLKLIERLDLLEQRQIHLIQLKEEQIERFPFLEHLPLQYWPKLYQQLSNLIEQIKQQNKLFKERDEVLKQLNRFEQKLINQFSDLIINKQASFTDKLQQWQSQLMEQESLLKQKGVLQERLNDYQQQKQAVLAKLKPYQEEMDMLLIRAEVDSEEAFLERASKYAQYQKLTEQREEARQQINLYLPPTLADAILAGEYLALADLKAKMTDYQEKIALQQRLISELQQKCADQSALLSQEEHSEQFIHVKHDYYKLRDQLNEQARNWLVYRMAFDHIQKTKTRFQTSYLPQILLKASELLSTLTRHRYQQVLFEPDTNQLCIQAKDGSQYQLKELSQGTRDQLLIAIRLAISVWYSEQNELPFLIDDGFVHFDHDRKLVMLDVIKHLTKKHQVFYLTKSVEDHAVIQDYKFIQL